MESFKKGDRIRWVRTVKKTFRADDGEFQKVTRHKKDYDGEQCGTVLLDYMLRPVTAPLNELKKLNEKGVR